MKIGPTNCVLVLKRNGGHRRFVELTVYNGSSIIIHDIDTCNKIINSYVNSGVISLSTSKYSVLCHDIFAQG